MLTTELLEFTVQREEEGCRLDRFLSSKIPSYSRTFFQSLIKAGRVTVNSCCQIKNRTPLNPGDSVKALLDLTQDLEPQKLSSENIPLDIIYEDDMILIINKPRGMVVHPGAGHRSGTLANGLLFHCHKIREEFQSETTRPGIIHRLDKDTSGLLIAVKTLEAKNKYGALFSERRINKEYIAICIGIPKILTIKTQIMRHPIKRKEMTVGTDPTQGKEAITHCEVITAAGGLSLVKMRPVTGRTHQLRVHLKYAGAPILGDPIYGCPKINKQYDCNRQLLHAYKLQFKNDLEKLPLEFIAAYPDDLKQICSKYLFYNLC